MKVFLTEYGMLIVTAVYTVATVAICIFNFKSTKATRDQTEELMRQFEEANRAKITVRIEWKDLSWGIVFENTGKTLATDIVLMPDMEWIEKLETLINGKYEEELISKIDIDCFVEQSKHPFTLTPNQASVYYILHSGELYIQMSEFPLLINVEYKSNGKHYKEAHNITLHKGGRIYRTPNRMWDREISKLNKNIAKIAKSLENIGMSCNKEIK